MAVEEDAVVLGADAGAAGAVVLAGADDEEVLRAGWTSGTAAVLGRATLITAEELPPEEFPPA